LRLLYKLSGGGLRVLARVQRVLAAMTRHLQCVVSATEPP